jgi:tRNA (guanine37-N1)-methyltransferase
MAMVFFSLHPDFVRSYAQLGVMRASGLSVTSHQLRDFALDKHASVDGRPFGGGDGMVMRADVLARAVSTIENRYVILATPAAKPFVHADAKALSLVNKTLVFVCGRFAGVDQRFIDRYVDATFSVGDFVVSGGELPSLMIADAIIRQIPGVLGHVASAECDSFATGMQGLLEYPQYTQPTEFEGAVVPKVLLSGHHQNIINWKKTKSEEVTARFRPDLLT